MVFLTIQMIWWETMVVKENQGLDMSKPSILSGLQRVIKAIRLETPRVLNDDDGWVELSFGMFT